MSTANSPAGQNAPIGNFDQPVLAVLDPQTFSSVHTAIESSFSAQTVSRFLRSIESRNLRIRNFEAVLANGLLGPTTNAEYIRLNNADQGQIREYYLASLERVAPELRQKFFKLYAYY